VASYPNSYPYSYPASQQPTVQSTNIGAALNVIDHALRNLDVPPWQYAESYNAYVAATGSDGGFMLPQDYSRMYSERRNVAPAGGYSTTGISTAPLELAGNADSYYGVNPDPSQRNQFEWAQLLAKSKKFEIDPSEYGGILIGAHHAGIDISFYPNARDYASGYALYHPDTIAAQPADAAPAGKGLGIVAAIIGALTLFRK